MNSEVLKLLGGTAGLWGIVEANAELWSIIAGAKIFLYVEGDTSPPRLKELNGP